MNPPYVQAPAPIPHRRRRLPAVLALTCLGLCLGPVAGCVRAQPDAGTGWALTHLDLDLELGDAAIPGRGVAHLTLAASRSAGPTLRIDRGYQRFLSVEAPAGAVVTLSEDGSRADVRLGEPLERGAEMRVAFRYVIERPRPPNLTAHPQTAFASYSYLWHPVPHWGRESWRRDATGTLTLHMPPHWRSWSEGGQEVSAANGYRIERWHSEVPVWRSFVAGPFHVMSVEAEPVPLTLLFLEADTARAARYAEVFSRGYRALAQWFGPPRLDLREEHGGAVQMRAGVALAELPEEAGIGAKNDWHQMLVAAPILRARNAAFDVSPLGVPHLLASYWWGGAVRGANPGLVMAQHGLAHYSTLLVVEQLWGQERMRELMHTGGDLPFWHPSFSAKGYFELWRSGGDEPLSATGREAAALNAEPGVGKGAWVWHMLRRRVGDQVFFATLEQIQREFAGTSVSLDQMRQAFERAAPDAELDRFFREWLDRPGAPIVEVAWDEVHAEGADTLTLTLRQRGAVYHLPLAVALQTDAGQVQHRVHLTAREQRVEVAVPGRVRSVTLDPEHELLLWRPAYGPLPDEVRAH